MAHQPLSLPLEPPHTQFMEPIPNFNQNISPTCSFAYDRIENEYNYFFSVIKFKNYHFDYAILFQLKWFTER